jgi:hypothetical protein
MRFTICKYTLSLCCFFLFSLSSYAGKKNKQEIYQLTVYQYSTAAQEVVLHEYLKGALLPALHKMGYKNIGVFKALANDTAAVKTLYVYMAIKSLPEQLSLAERLNKDPEYQAAGATYLNADYTSPAYNRMAVILMKAFPLASQMQLPGLTAAKNERVYELRSYESATEKIFANKVHMFNEGGEIGLFKRINANAVFYASVIAGSHMPNLMYMTCYENKADRDAHWKTFVNDPLWKKISSAAEYKNNVSHIDIYFLQPLEFSDF